MAEPLILSATRWTTNAEMIRDVAKLRYLRKNWKVLDPTYGRGIWWKQWRPNELVTHDIAIDGVNFLALPHHDEEFNAVAFDPPYVSVGGRKTTGIADFYSRYGLGPAPKSPYQLQHSWINPGMAECARVLKPKGILLVKCKNYVSSGSLWPGVFETMFWANAMQYGQQPQKLVLVDELVMVREAGIQPERTRKDGRPVRQHHARQNTSTLLIYRKAA